MRKKYEMDVKKLLEDRKRVEELLCKLSRDTERADIMDYKRGRPSLWYGGFKSRFKREPTEAEYQQALKDVNE